jgi:hypothetical protein
MLKLFKHYSYEGFFFHIDDSQMQLIGWLAGRSTFSVSWPVLRSQTSSTLFFIVNAIGNHGCDLMMLWSLPRAARYENVHPKMAYLLKELKS